MLLREARRIAATTREERFEAEAFVHLRALHRTALRLTRNAHDAEDLVQETCLRAYRAFDSFTPGTNARAWLYTILRRARIDGLRKSDRTLRTTPWLGEEPTVPAPPAEELDGHEDLERAIDALPECLRLAVVLRDLEQFTYAEIAEALKVPIGTVMSRIHRGRARLRAALGPGQR